MKFAACALVWFGAVAICSSQGAPPAGAEKTTLTGVFTADQAAKGMDTFSTICTGCHKVTTHTGVPFKNRWLGKPVAELYTLIKDTMPEDAAGTLSATEAIQVVAFILKNNGMPAGPAELPADPAALKTIRIELPVK